MTYRFALLPAVAAALALGAIVSCAGNDPISVSMVASAESGADVEVTYWTEDGKVTEVVSSPWSLELARSGSFNTTLEVRNTESSGDVRCQVSSETFPTVATGGQAAAFCFASVTRSGDTTSWSTSTDFELFTGPISVADSEPFARSSTVQLDSNRVLFGGSDGVRLLDASAGTLEVIEGSRDFTEPRNPAMTSDGTVYAVDEEAAVVQVLPSDGSGIAEFARFPGEFPKDVWAIDDRLYVRISEPDALIALDEVGGERWRYEIARSLARVNFVEVISLGDGRLLIAGDRLDLQGIDVEDGRLSFSYDVPTAVTAVARRDDLVLISFFDTDDDVGFTWGLRAENFDEIGSQEMPEADFETAGSLIVFDSAGVPYGGDGDRISRLDPNTFEVESTVTASDQRLVAAGSDTVYTVRRTESSLYEIVERAMAEFD